MGIEIYWIVIVAGIVFCFGYYLEVLSLRKNTLLRLEGYKRERIPQVIVEVLVKYDPLEIVRQVSSRAGITPPAFLVVRDSPLAYVICVGEITIVCGRQLLLRISEKELEGVIAHEVGHLKEGPLFRYFWYSLGGLVCLSALFLVASPASHFLGAFIPGLSPQETALLFMYLSLCFILVATACFYLSLLYQPQREFAADRKALSFTRYPWDFVSVLSRAVNEEDSHAATKSAIAGLGKKTFDTHPPMRMRVEAALRILRKRGVR